MALEDVAAFRAIHGSTVLNPSDGNQTAKLVAAMADLEGISFLRTTRIATPLIYDADEEFPVGGSRSCARPTRTTSRSSAPASRCTRP
jgi:transketolase